jgi:hypothetical protein
MEYFVGALLTLVAVFVTRMFTTRDIGMAQKIRVTYSQSDVYELLRPLLPDSLVKKMPPTQASKHYEKLFTKIFFQNDKAYWIKDNTFYVANMVEGAVDRENAQPVDIMAMDKVQLNEMIFIIEI